MVEPSQVLQLSRGEPAGEVPGPVEAPSGARSERIRNEPLRRQVRTADVAPGPAGPGQQELARYTAGDRLQTAVQHIGPGPGQGPADAHPRGAPLNPGTGRVGGILRRSIEIENLLDLRVAVDALGQLRRQRLAGQIHRAEPGRQLPHGQLGHGGGDRVDQRHLAPGRQRRQGQGVVGQDHRPAPGEGGEDLEDRQVEADGGRGQDPGEVFRGESRARPEHPFDRRPVLQSHPLRASGRAGGVDHIGQVAGARQRLRVLLGLAGDGLSGGGDLALAGQLSGAPVLGQQEGDPRIFRREGQPTVRIGRIERHVGGSRLEDAEQRRDQLAGTAHQDAHALLRAGAEPPQVMGQAVGPAVQGVIGPALLAPPCPENQGRGRGGARGLGLEQLVQAAPPCRCALRPAPGEQDLVALLDGQQRQLGDRAVVLRGRRGHPGEQAVEVVQHPSGGRGVEQIGVPLQGDGEPRGPLGRRQGEVELGGGRLREGATPGPAPRDRAGRPAHPRRRRRARPAPAPGLSRRSAWPRPAAAGWDRARAAGAR